mgnify:CR=1 FL=1
MKEFDYYIFIDYSENLIGYSIIEKTKLKEVLPKILRFRHYRAAKDKKLYLKNVKKAIERDNIKSSFLKLKIKEIHKNIEVKEKMTKRDKIYRVRASVNPTNRIIAKRARDSSGRVPLYDLLNTLKLINFSYFVQRGGFHE